nr:hypothetical protein Itr_chr06CG15720 [Ipomoea trifida]
MKPLAHSKHSSRKPLPTITKVTSELRRATLDARQRNQTTSMRIAAMMESSGQHASSNNNGDFGGSSGELR